MFLRKALLVLSVAILGTSWFLGEGFVAAYPIVQYQPAEPVYGYPYGQPMYPNIPNNQNVQPIVNYPPSYSDTRKNGPLIRKWDAAHDYAKNLLLAITGQM